MSGIPEITAYPLPTAQQLPANLARWSLEPRRAVLLVHDMQRYFLRPLPESLRAGLVANAARLRRWCVEQGVQIAYTAQPGSMTEEQRGLLKDFWGPGMRASPADREVVEELAPGPVLEHAVQQQVVAVLAHAASSSLGDASSLLRKLLWLVLGPAFDAPPFVRVVPALVLGNRQWLWLEPL